MPKTNAETAKEVADKLSRLGLNAAAAEYERLSGAPSCAPEEAAHKVGPEREIFPPFYERLRRHSPYGPVFLEGPAGTAKTWAIRRYADECGLKLFVQQGHGGVNADELRGTRGLNEQGTFFEPGLLTRSLQHENSAYFLDEINMVDPGVNSIVNNLLDGSGELTIPETGEVCRIPAGWRFFGAFNAHYAGTRPLNAALKSRATIVECDYYPPVDEAALICRKYPEFPMQSALTLVKVAHAVRAARADGQHDFDFCLRTAWQMALEWMACGDPLEAFEVVVLPKVGDRYAYADVRDGLKHAAELILSEAV